MSSQKRKQGATVSLRLSKRNNENASEKNPLLKLIPDVSVDTFTYTESKQWEALESDESCMMVFKKWYNDNNKKYKHIKHAFNSLCKHYGLITIKHIVVKNDNKKLTTLWTMQSFNNRTWIYQACQVIEDNIELIASKDGSCFTLQDKELEPISKLIEMVCA